MSETEDEEEYRLKESQTSRLQEFFEENPCPKKAYYLQKIKEIEDILKRDRIVNEWGIPADEESH